MGNRKPRLHKGVDLDTPPRPPPAGARKRDWLPGEGVGPVPRENGRGTNLTRKYATEDEARNSGVEWMKRKGCGGPKSQLQGRMRYEGKVVGSEWHGGPGGSVRVDYDEGSGKHLNFQCGDDLFHALYDEGRTQDVCLECSVDECNRKKDELLGRGNALRDRQKALDRERRGIMDLDSDEAKDRATRAWMDKVDGFGGFAESAESLALDLDGFAMGNCPKRQRDQAKREANRLRQTAARQRAMTQHVQRVRQAARGARSMQGLDRNSPNFWRTVLNVARFR